MVNDIIENVELLEYDHPQYIIGVGASAGGLEPIQEFLANIPNEIDNWCIIIAQHLSPTYKSMLVQLLSRNTSLHVTEAYSGQTLEKKIVYITPPNSDITIQKNKIYLSKPLIPSGPKPSVDSLFHSIAMEHKENGIAIILSGTGTDGSKGLKDVKAAGGFTLVQDPETAKYDGMPLASIEHCDVDVICPPIEMGRQILTHIKNKSPYIPHISTEENPDYFDKIIELLSSSSKTDFSNYKKNSVLRRLNKRISSLGFTNKKHYYDYIEKNPSELENLLSLVLIGVTKFFRDYESFLILEDYLKKIFSEKKKGDPIRIWVPGCASGEEAYTIGIIVHKVLKGMIANHTIQIFSTDISESSLTHARKGVYSKSAIENVPEDILNEYFVKNGNQYEVIKAIKQMILFSKHDLISNPPFLKIDLLSCRNLLIYFNATLQKVVIPIFHYALNETGILFLGKSESIGQYSDLFFPENETHKIYAKKNVTKVTPSTFPIQQFPKSRPGAIKKLNTTTSNSILEIVKDTIFNTYEHCFVIINESLDILEIRGDVRPYLGFTTGSIHSNLLKLLNKDLQVETRSILSNTIKDKIASKTPILKTVFLDNTFYLRIIVKPLLYNDHRNDLFMVIFEKFDENELIFKVRKNEELEESSRIRELEDDLNAAKEHLQNFIEELEANNEELQSLNEEFQATNEELQSTNEELETTNEELQSTNEEMQIAYTELKVANENLENKEKELLKSQENIEALLNNTLQSFILIDKDYKILAFNPKAKELLYKLNNQNIERGELIINYLQPEYLEKFHKDFSLAKLGTAVEGIFSTPISLEESIWYKYNFTPVRNSSNQIEVISYSLLDITDHHTIKLDLKETRKLINAIFNSTDIGISITDSDGYYLDVNQGYCDLLNYTKEELIGKHFTMIIPELYRAESLKLYHSSISEEREIQSEWKLQKKDGTLIEVTMTSSIVTKENGEKIKITNIKDVSENKKYKNLLQDTQEAVSVGGWEIDLMNNKITWTKEVYNIHEVPLDYNLQPYNFYSFFEPESLHKFMKAIGHATETGQPFKLELQFITAKNNKRWVRVTCKAIREHNITNKLFFTIQDITDEKLVKEEVMKLSLVASKTTNAVIITNYKQEIEWVNEGFENLTGYKLKDIKGKNPRFLQGKATNPEAVTTISDKLKLLKPFSEEVLNYTKEGTAYWVKIDFSPIVNDKNELTHYVAIERDITKEKESAEQIKNSLIEKEILLSEIHHRVKNNMAVISGLIELQSTYVKDDESRILFKESINRIKSMALIHEKLYKSRNWAKIQIGDYITDLVDHIQKSYNYNDIKIEMNIHIINEFIDITQAIPCALILNELINNCFTHAFVDRGSGKITINFSMVENIYQLEVVDDGIGYDPDQIKKSSLGLTLIYSLAKQLKGNFNSFNKNGTTSILTFPVAKDEK